MVTKDTGIIEAVQNHPEIMEVFAIEDINKVIAEAEANK